MPNPKRRHSKARRDKRRAHDALRVPQTTLCPNCREPRMPHRVCPKCGYYKGRQVVQVEETYYNGPFVRIAPKSAIRGCAECDAD